MERIRIEAKACWITCGKAPYSDFVFDEEKFIALVCDSYQYITEPNQCILPFDDENCNDFTYDILAA